jgi:hypothetical protein
MIWATDDGLVGARQLACTALGSSAGPKQILHRYLDKQRKALVAKSDGIRMHLQKMRAVHEPQNVAEGIHD